MWYNGMLLLYDGGSQGDGSQGASDYSSQKLLRIYREKISKRWKKSYLPAVADFIGKIGETVPL